ncbi:MAG TPA: aminoacetone oxidase family FAD-binding enzyme [Terracidiphilus sp.]|jgi:predicted Rossmann fold flavoprotein|nr:aminoacetone oxidase family FAD-binding enzyme [Terracidiphilus sp.]
MSQKQEAGAPPRRVDAIVLGAGAAGLMCAAVAGQRGRRVALLDHNAQPGRKILISGGGRCNFTNIHCTPANFLSENPHFAKSALALYTPQHFLELVERHKIPWHEKTLGQLFCDRSAHDILNLLLAECESSGNVEIVLSARNIAVKRDNNVERDNSGFRVSCSQGELIAAALVVATGGLSIPQLGATSFAYDLARQFNLAVIPPRPALVPLLLGGAEAPWTALTGVSAEVIAHAGPAQAGQTPFREKLLVTHRGLSGPAVLQASSYWRTGQPLTVDFAPGSELLASLRTAGARRDAATYRQALRAVLPQRLAVHLADTTTPAHWTNAAFEAAERGLHHYEFHPTGTEGFAKAEVTAGGIDTAALQARTLEARTVPGLFFIGEAVDVTGWLGGFNFQWAWASAVAAARAL